MQSLDGWEGLSPAVMVAKGADDLDIAVWQSVFKSPEGQRVLAHLRQATIEQPVFIPGEDPSYGYSRAGMCELVRMIEKRVERSND
jgi:hypothetical protein